MHKRGTNNLYFFCMFYENPFSHINLDLDFTVGLHDHTFLFFRRVSELLYDRVLLSFRLFFQIGSR
jgi:hypothetical protein